MITLKILTYCNLSLPLFCITMKSPKHYQQSSLRSPILNPWCKIRQHSTFNKTLQTCQRCNLISHSCQRRTLIRHITDSQNDSALYQFIQNTQNTLTHRARPCWSIKIYTLFLRLDSMQVILWNWQVSITSNTVSKITDIRYNGCSLDLQMCYLLPTIQIKMLLYIVVND